MITGRRFLAALLAVSPAAPTAAHEAESLRLAPTYRDGTVLPDTPRLANGSVRMTGDQSDGYPCDTLRPVLARKLGLVLDSCSSVRLLFRDARTGREQPVYDLWLVAGDQGEGNVEDGEVVDFYEPITLGEVGDVACGTFEFERLGIGGGTVTVLERHVRKASC